MKAMLAITALLVLGATAQGKVAPLENQAAVTAFDVSTASQLAVAREAGYFHAPQSLHANERFLPPCRLQHIVFEKTRLAQSCR